MSDEIRMPYDKSDAEMDRLEGLADRAKNVEDFCNFVLELRQAHDAKLLLEDMKYMRDLSGFLEGLRATLWDNVKDHQQGKPVEDPNWSTFAHVILSAMYKN